MSLAKILLITAIILFGLIGGAAFFKKSKKQDPISYDPTPELVVEEIELAQDFLPNSAKSTPPSSQKEEEPLQEQTTETPTDDLNISVDQDDEEDRIEEFFNRVDPRLPIVETLTYKSRVNWLKGRPAWLSDYAAHYETSRHFIARSLNGKPDYLKQDIAEGDRFNVLRKDLNYQFHLVIDISTCKMRFYYIDLDSKDRVLLKTYRVSLGRSDSKKASGLLTPLGRYEVGSKVAIYKPNVMGFHKGQRIEMIRTFGTRWIPFEKEISDCTEPAKGFGLHGVPWVQEGNKLVEDSASLGKYESDGCIRLATPDIEEIFAIIITKPTTVELVKNFSQAKFLDK
ncbi:MAG: L,D-transpeptidase [Parachlamydiaceae bacterium]